MKQTSEGVIVQLMTIRRSLYDLALLVGLVFGLPAATLGASTERQVCLTGDGRQPCEAAYRADPDDTEVIIKLAWTRISNHEPAEGIDFLREASQRHPQDWRLHFNLAGALAAVAAYHMAGEPVERAMALNDDPRIKHLAAEIYQNNDQPGLAHEMHLILARAGWRVAMFELAEDYALGRGAGYDQPLARHWYERAGAAGHVLAMRILADKLEAGAFGEDPDLESARYWREQAARATQGLPGG